MGDRGPVPGVYRPDQVRRRPVGLVGTIRPRGGCGLVLLAVALWAGIIGAFVALVAAFGTQAP